MGIIPRPTYAVIDMERFGNNIDIARNLSKSDIIAVVKADAYGHGAKILAKYAYEEKHFTKTRFLFEANDLVPGYRNDQSNDRYPTLWKIQLDEADGRTSAGERSGK